MSTAPPPSAGRPRLRGLGPLLHPVVGLIAVALVAGALLRSLFFALSKWIWHFQQRLPDAEITTWARWAVNQADGIEPYALLAAIGVHWLATGAGLALLARAAPRWRAAATALLLVAAFAFMTAVPPRPPMADVAGRLPVALLVVAAALAATWLVRVATRDGKVVSASLAVALIPICFIPMTLPSFLDIPCVMAPALRFENGAPPARVYLQYDLLPSLLGLGWSRLGGAPLTFPVVTRASYYAAMLGAFVLARRMFDRTQLGAALLVSLLLVRFYGIMVDANALPQVTPIRMELWLILLGCALRWGLADWRVGLALALLCFFSRSMGTLYVGAYALALSADFFARRRALPRGERRPLLEDALAAGRRVIPAVVLIGLAFVAARLVFGEFGSDAIALYRRLGVGMMPIGRASFYWWLLPLTGAVGWLVFTGRGPGTDRRGQARIFAVALIVINSLYFFGRSHEHNLVNLGTSFLFLFFLGVDMAWPSEAGVSAGVFRWLFRLVPWAVVAICAFGYSGRIVTKVEQQKQAVVVRGPLPPMDVNREPAIDCDEVARAVGNDRRVYFFSKHDYWYYQRCHYVPKGYTQPMVLNVLTAPLAAELNQLLGMGYRIVVPRRGDWSAAFADIRPRLVNLELTETPGFQIYRLASAPTR